MAAEWAAYAVLVGMCSLFITIFLHMVANAFGLQTLRMWVKAEYMQVLATFLIIAFAAATDLGSTTFFSTGESVISQVTGRTILESGNVDLAAAQAIAAQGGSADRYSISKAYLGLVVSCEKSLYSTIYNLNFYFESASKLSYDVRGNEPAASGFALSGWVTLYHYINNNIIYLVLFHYIQYSILVFSQYTMLSVFLPIGLALRAFPITRGAGGLVTAFALGFAFVFPMSYMLIVAMMPGVNTTCSQLSQVSDSAGYRLLTSNQDSGNPCLANEGAQIENYYKIKMIEGESWLSLSYWQHIVASLFMQALFYPLAALIITFSFIRQTGSLFGADLAEIGRGLIKII